MGTISETTVANRIFEKTNGQMVYLSGYMNPVKYAVLQVLCTKCGEVNEMKFHNLTAQYRGCPACRKKAAELKAAEIDKERELKEKAREERRREIAEENRRRERRRIERSIPHNCPVCGAPTTRPKYCSDKCMNKANWATKEVKRREKLREATVDKDITVMGLFKRDAGVCYICGGRCNVEDYTICDGYFVAGDWYPSIDHVIPLSKGGLHSWKNVKLAHRRCNSLKSNKVADE